MDHFGKKWRKALFVACLSVAALAAYWPLLQNGFIRYDDPAYVTGNVHVLGGLTWSGVKWAFTTVDGGNWHPLTWLSHMLDVQLFGLTPKWHHAVNLLLHVLNTAALFLLLCRLTGAEGRSFFVAALFALHPLHVESVAWLSERKDLLSTLFLLSTLWAYAFYARACDNSAVSRARVWLAYAGGLIFFAFGLMSKPMLVTVPFLLLLLDFWPLQRGFMFRERGFRAALRGIWEKVPFLLLSVISSVVALYAQSKSGAVSLSLPIIPRFENAAVSYVKYVAKTFWPKDLSVFYPHPDTRYPHSEQWAWWWVLAALLLLVASVLIVVQQRRKRPWMLMGWFWYLIALLPVIGLVQVGLQGMADRYTYIPLIGVFICLVWISAEMGKRLAWGDNFVILGGVAALALCAGLTHRQSKFWQSDFTLFQHALLVAPNNAVAECHVGIAYGEAKEFALARQHFQAAIEANPSLPDAYYGLGFTLENQGDLVAAIERYQETIRLQPNYEPAHNRLANCLWSLGKKQEALAEFKLALQLKPTPEGYFAVAQMQLQLGHGEAAAESYRAALRLRPDWLGALSNLAWLLATDSKPEVRNGQEALRLARQAMTLSRGEDPRVYAILAAASAETGDFAQAVSTAQKGKELALRAGQKDVAEAIQMGLVNYQQHLPLRQ